MNLPAKTAKAIATGRATQVRVLPGEPRLVKRKNADRRDRTATYWVQPWRPSVGGEVSLDGYRVAITAKTRAEAGDLTYEDAKAEGHGSIDNAKVAWVRDHDEPWLEHHKVRLADALGPGVVRAIMLARFEERWTDEPVWVVVVRPVPARPQFMARVTGKTSSASMSIDPDAEVPCDEWVNRYAKTAEAFCIGRQLARKREAEAQRADRGRSMRKAA